VVLLALQPQPVVLGTCKWCGSKGGSCGTTCSPHVEHVAVVIVRCVQLRRHAQLSVRHFYAQNWIQRLEHSQNLHTAHNSARYSILLVNSGRLVSVRLYVLNVV
jgi:hypothetical protein